MNRILLCIIFSECIVYVNICKQSLLAGAIWEMGLEEREKQKTFQNIP